LGDIAAISSPHMSDDEAVIGLQKIVIEDAPAPGKSTTIGAVRVLERLQEEGVNTRQIGYAFPRSITVTSAGRTLTYQEVRSALEARLAKEGRDITLRELDYKENLKIAPGTAEIEVTPLDLGKAGAQAFYIAVRVEERPELRFKVKALTDEWRELPVAARPIPKGNVIGDQDIKMARLNISALPDDIAYERQTIIGHEAGRGIADGEVFRRAKLMLPPVIKAGATVTLIYKTDYLQASAIGTALEAGAMGAGD
jgi:flagellar basal body P-ring formation protein FlgA